jgi:hypothetical protein
VRVAPQPGAKAGSQNADIRWLNSRGVIRRYKKFSQKSIDTLLCVQLKDATSPALSGSAAGESTTGKIKNRENKKSVDALLALR